MARYTILEQIDLDEDQKLIVLNGGSDGYAFQFIYVVSYNQSNLFYKKFSIPYNSAVFYDTSLQVLI